MSREKRALEKEGLPNEKRQRLNLASVVVEAVKNDGLQKLCQSLEPLLRKVIGEEVERALAKFQLSNADLRTSPASSQEPDTERTNLQLQFKNRVALPLFTGSKVEGEQGSPLHVVLQDAKTGDLITIGPEASAKLEIVVLHGDFSVDDNEDWSQEEFASHEVRERDGKGPLLTGDLTVALKGGVGSLGELSFTDNSSWIRSRKFRLGVKVVEESYWGPRIREAKSEAFVVKDHRGELYKKHYPPELQDEVWRLDKIGKEGAFHRRLYKAGIKSVEDFLRLAVMDSQKLRNILGSGMSNKMWEGTIEHAKTCVLSQKLYVYYADEKQHVGIIFNTIFQLMGLISETRYLSADSLSDSEKIYVDKLVKVAYENWGRVVEYTGEAIVDLSLREHDIQEEESERHSDVTSCSQAAQVLRPTPSIPPSPAQWSPLLAATPGNEWLFYKELRTPTTNQAEDFTEDQIRAKSLEFLDNEDMNRQMQQLLYMITGATGGETASVATKSIKRVRGRWLKIKAALRWGISIRNRAAARRARHVNT